MLSLPPGRRERALSSILALPDQVDILGWKAVAPVMASQHEGPGRGLNLLSREALAAASILEATVIMATGNENQLLRQALREAGLSDKSWPDAVRLELLACAIRRSERPPIRRNRGVRRADGSFGVSLLVCEHRVQLPCRSSVGATYLEPKILSCSAVSPAD